MSATTIRPKANPMSEAHRLQYRTALLKANATRTRWRMAKAPIVEAGRVNGARLAAAVLREVPADAADMDLGDLMLAVPGYGKERARQLLSRKVISPWRKIAELSPRQREDLAVAMETLADEQAAWRRS